tara:strand:- start:289 stop:510 length:222 start_codon:yes stop_codon:yes gene_type:complete
MLLLVINKEIQMAHASEEIITKGHHLVGIEWPVIGSKGDKYKVIMFDRGFECDCPAYRKCKHIKGIEEGLIND